MGFDPRRWRPPAGGPSVTTNVEALLAENEALRRQVRQLQQQLELAQQERLQRERHWERQAQQARSRAAAGSRVTSGSGPALTPEQVARWAAAMARHPRWSTLRLGPPGGLRALIEEQRRHWWNPALDLEQELDRRCPGLGAELAMALRGPHSRGRWAVRAAFALYGQRAPEWLAEEPLRVVEELLRRLERLEQRQTRPGAGAAGGPRRGTRTENHTDNGAGGARAAGGDRSRGSQGTQGGHGTQGGQGSRAQGRAAQDGVGSGGARGRDAAGRGRQQARGPRPPSDPRLAALQLLGLEPGASLQAIKRAYRRLAKAHHPDLGGDVEAFHRLDAAYRLLIG